MKGSTSEQHQMAAPRQTKRSTKGRAGDAQAAPSTVRSAKAKVTARVRKDGSKGKPVSDTKHTSPARRRAAQPAVPAPTWHDELFGPEELNVPVSDKEKWSLNEIVLVVILTTTLIGIGIIIGKLL